MTRAREKVNVFTQYFVSQIWRLAGSRITEFCLGYPTFLLQDASLEYEAHEDDANDLFEDENRMSSARNQRRLKRQTTGFIRGRSYRGQTQSQYLNFGNGNQPGKAEAESSPEGSRAVVSKWCRIITSR